MVDATQVVGWGGVGVGMITSLALAHMVGATQHHMFLALARMVGATQHHVSCTCTHGCATQHHVSCTCTHGWCYATSCFLHLHAWLVLRNIMFLALAHMVGATQHHVSCTCTHGRCYATSWVGVGLGWGGVGMITFLALAHMVGATQHHIILALAHMAGATQHHVSCTCTHGWCYATSCFLHLHTWSMLRNIMGWGGVGWGWYVPCTCKHGNIMFVDVNVRIKLVCICTINGFLLPKFKHWWWPNHRHSKEQPQKAWLSDIAICSHVQIHRACQCIVTLAPKILWPTALLNAWTIMTFPKSSFYHTNHTFLASINVWMMDFSSINARIKQISSAQNTILCRMWLRQKLTFHHNEITVFEHSQYPTQRTFGEPPAPSVYIYICTCIECIVYTNKYLNILCTVRIKSFNQTNMLLRSMLEPLL